MAKRKNKDLNHLISSEEWLLAHHRGESNTQEVKTWSICPMLFGGELPSKVLPIHLACSLRAPEYVLSALLANYRKCASKRESAHGRLPLHIACQSGSSASAIGVLLEGCPGALRTKDSLGRLPLHLACSDAPVLSPSLLSSSWISCVSVVDALLAACPEAARIRDNRGQMPLHIACSAGAPVAAIRLLIDAYPDAVTAETNTGSTPMMRAVRLQNGPNKSEIISTLQFMTSVNRLGRSLSHFAPETTKRRKRYLYYSRKSKKRSKDPQLRDVVRKSHAKLLRHLSDSSLFV